MSSLQLLSVVSVALSVLEVEAFAPVPSSHVVNPQRIVAPEFRERTVALRNALYDNNDDDEDDDDDFIDTESLGDWRTFRKNLAFDVEEASGTSASVTSATKSVSKENEEVLSSQNKVLAEEYRTDVWAHQTSTPEVGGLVVRMPIEVELYRNHRHSLIGAKLQRMLDDEDVDIGVWYARAKNLVEDEMQKIASMADDGGQIDATELNEDASEMLALYLDNQETWQEVCLVLERNGSSTKTLVLNRPMAFKLTENLGKLVLFGAFTGDAKFGERADIVRFMAAFSSECAVYVGGDDDQGKPAIMIHGIADLPGAVEISPGSKIYRGGLEAAIEGVLDGKYSPLEFRFFVGCHEYEESALDVLVHLGKFQPIACARSVALKQCISLPKPLWHEVLELCGGEMEDLSSLELLKKDDVEFQVLDETDYGDEIEEIEIDDDDDDDVFY